MRAIQPCLFAALLILSSGFPTAAEPVHPITLEVDSGVHQFEIHRIDPESVSVKLGTAYKFNFSKNEIRSATSEVVGAALSNARVLLGRAQNVDPTKLARLAEDLDRSSKELAGLDAVYQWLLPETTTTWTQVDAARRNVEGTRQALEAVAPYKRTIQEYLAEGYPFPEDWKEVFEHAHEALSKIPIEDLKESEVADLSDLYERFDNLTNRQTGRSLSHIEELKLDIERLIASEKLTNGLWGQLRVRIDRSLARIPEGESRKAAEESLAPLREKAEAFLEQHKGDLALQEVEERLTRLESLIEIAPASAEAVSSEATLVSTLISGIEDEGTRSGIQSRLSSIRERLEESTKQGIQEGPIAPPPPLEVPKIEEPARVPPVQSAAPSLPESAEPPPAQVPIYQNRSALIAVGAGVAVLLLLALVRLLGKSRKKSPSTSAPRKVLKEPPPPSVFTPPLTGEDEYSRAFSKPAPPVREAPKKRAEPQIEVPSSPFPDLPPIPEPAPLDSLYSRTNVDPELIPPLTDVSPAPASSDLELDTFLASPVEAPNPPDAESKGGTDLDSPTPFPELSDEPVPSLDSIFGDPTSYERIEPSGGSSEDEASTDESAQETPTASSSLFEEEEDPLRLSIADTVEEEIFLPEREVALHEVDPFPWDPLTVESQVDFPGAEETPSEEPFQAAPFPTVQESEASTALIFEDAAAAFAMPAPAEESDSPVLEPPFAGELPVSGSTSVPIDLEPLLLEGQLVELDGSETLDRTGVLSRLDQGIPFPGVHPLRLFPLGQAMGLLGEKNGKLELTVLDREVDGSFSFSAALLDTPAVFSISRRLGAYWIQDGGEVTAYTCAKGKLDRIESGFPIKGSGKNPQTKPFGLRHVYRPVASYEDRVFCVFPDGRLEGYRLAEEGEPRIVERSWTFPSEETSRKLVSNAVPLGDRIAVVDSNRNLILVEPSDGRVYWEGPLQDLYLPASGPVVLTSLGNRLVYVCKTVGEGMKVSDFTGPGAPVSSHPIVKCAAPSLFGMDDGILLVSESEIAFFEDRDLALSWSLPLGCVEPIDLSVDRSQIAVLVKEPEGHTRVLVLGKNSGSVLWETEPDETEMTRFAGAVVQDGNLLLWGENANGEGVLRLLE